MRVFVSYRRDDAGGHAGRLADDLAERMPGTTVFHDVESIALGADFVTAIQQAIASADAVLVVIGPDWATIGDPAGGPRLGRPDDVVRLEVASALSQQKWVIPVLVGAAVMPQAGSLPDDIAPIAHRNAVEIRQEAWDDDVARLITALGPTTTRPAEPVATEAQTPRRRNLAPAIAAGAVAVLAVAVLAWSPWSGPAGRRTGTERSGDTTPTAAGDTVDDAGGRVLELPAVAGTLLHSVVGDRLAIEVVSASMSEGSEPVVETVVRFENRADGLFAVEPTTIRLQADGRLVAPRPSDSVLIPGLSEDDVASTFDLAAEPAELVLLVNYQDDTGEIPLLGAPVPGAPPELRPAAVPASIGLLEFSVGPPAITTFSDRFVVAVPVVVTNRDRFPINFWSRSFRLVVDGSLQAPVTEVNEVVAGNATGEATFEWDTALDVEQLVFHIEDWGEVREVPLTGA